MKRLLIFLLFTGMVGSMAAQFDPQNGSGLNYKLNDDGSHYLKFTLTNQVWLRYNESNPGSTLNGTPTSETFDIGIRRARIQMYGALNNRSFIYVQMGMNNFNHLSDRKFGFFFHDAIAEYSIVQKYLSIGGGLTNWVGLSRLSNASIATFLALDHPIFPFATIDATDQFNRKLSVYAKGKFGKLDYRVMLTDPMDIEKSAGYNPATALSANSQFAPGAAHKQYQGYAMYQFLDQESNLTPYLAGTYIGSKKVFNLGGGFIHQRNATWRLNNGTDTLRSDMTLLAADLFADMPVRKDKGDAITLYASVFFNNYGKGYLRNNAPMNPANGTVAGTTTFNGPGNAFPIFGNGTVYYAQLGYVLGKGWINQDKLKIQPYVCYMLGDFDRLETPMRATNVGINFFVNNHNAKITLDWQQRPVYLSTPDTEGRLPFDTRKNTVVLGFQVSI